MPSIFDDDSYLDFRTMGHIVSSFRVYAVKENLSTNPFATRLTGEPVSNKQRACEVVDPILTKTVGSSIIVFWRIIFVKDVDFEVVGGDEPFFVWAVDELRFLEDVEGFRLGDLER